MKRMLLFLGCLSACIIFSACKREYSLKEIPTLPSESETEANKDAEVQSEDVKDAENVNEETAFSKEETENSKRYIEMLVNESVYKVELYDTQAANALYEQLPLTLTFEDFNHVEKIGYLPETLPTDKEPDGCDPDVGDLCLYAPWGNLSIFYQDFRYSDSLIMLGHLENGIEELGNMNEDFEVTIRVAE